MSIRGRLAVDFVGRVGSDGEVEEVRLLGVDVLEANRDGYVLTPVEQAIFRRALKSSVRIVGPSGREGKK